MIEESNADLVFVCVLVLCIERHETNVTGTGCMVFAATILSISGISLTVLLFGRLWFNAQGGKRVCWVIDALGWVDTRSRVLLDVRTLQHTKTATLLRTFHHYV